jgi:hypothetical protein
MRKIDKDFTQINSTKYKDWVADLEAKNIIHPASRTYYDDILMDLYKCQNGVCAYTERYICIEELYNSSNWIDGKYKISDEEDFKRTDHAGELEHFDPELKNDKYWLWDNFFMIDSTINSRKSDRKVFTYLKPDLEDYTPEKYFDYDEKTHRFIPNTDIENENTIKEIQYMIDEVLFLNHGVIKNDRRDFINDLKQKIKLGLNYKIDRFFTSVSWCI